MAVHDANEVQSVTGFVKEIDAAGLSMVMDNLQVYQYQYPQKSTVREIVSNAKDAVKEKRIVEAILTGKSKVEDFYIQREEDVYKSSNFDPSYFDLNWLDLTSDKVEILHEYGDQIDTKDKLIIRDNGVGLGGKRLEGYFKLSWSSKRNSKDALGKFGIGAKAALSLGVNSYRMTSYYNGAKFTFDIYSHKVDSAIPKFNLVTGKVNPSYTFENGYVAYYEETDHKNGTEITIETKKHHRSMFIDAVKSQLLHFENVNFIIKNENSYSTEVDIQAHIIYEDDDIILSNNQQFSKPYLLIGNPGSMVSYGYIDFQELELEQKYGNIGIKIRSEEVTINPSRESVIWDERTRDTIVSKFNRVVDIATEYVSKSLKETDIVEWMNKARAVLMGHSSDEILNRLSRVIDRENIVAKFSVDKSIMFSMPKTFFKGLNVRTVFKTVTNRGYKSSVKEGIKREDIGSWGDFHPDRLYVTTGKASFRKDMFIISRLSTNPYDRPNFTLITLPDADSDKALLDSFDLKSPDQLKTYNRVKAGHDERDKLIKHILASKKVINYDDIDVPDDFMKDASDDSGSEEVDSVETVQESDKERRRREQKILVLKPSWILRNTVYESDTSFDWQRKELAIEQIEDFEGVCVYGYKEDDEELHFAVNILCAGEWDIGQLEGDEIRVFKIAKTLTKHFKTGVHVKDFLFSFKDKHISMHDELVRWNTGRLIGPELEKVRFLSNFGLFNKEMSDAYNELRTYVHENYSVPFNSVSYKGYGMNRDTFSQFVEQIDKVTQLQMYITNNPDDAEGIAAHSKALFNLEIGGALGIDMDKYNMLQKILEYGTPVATLLNKIPCLTDAHSTISAEVETAVKEYVQYKGVELG
jgi:hypothetical protein